MPELWFRYGGTEVSLEVPEDLRYERIEARELKPDEGLWRRISEFSDDLGRDLGARGVTILYDHAGDRLPLLILSHLIGALERYAEKIRVIVSSWRLEPSEGWEDARRGLREYGVRAEIIDARSRGLEELGGIRVLRDLLDDSEKLILTSSEPHGLLGRASIREALALGGFARMSPSSGDLSSEILETWSRLVGELKPWAVTTLNDHIYLGDAEKVAREVYEASLEIQVSDFDAVIAGCGGKPRDSAFQLVAHVLGLLKDSVIEGGLIGLVAECGRGLGSKSFMEAVFGGGGTPLDHAIAELVRGVSDERRVALTTILPKSLMRRLFNIRCFDTPEEMLTYILRRYTREARILILEKPHVKPVRGSMLGRS